MIPTGLLNLILGGLTTMTATIMATTGWLAGSLGITGNLFFDATNNSTPSTYINDEVIRTYPVNMGDETCDGGATGALLCSRTVRLTGSGGHRAHNAGSWVCSTSSCAIISATVMLESNPNNDQLYVGWTGTPSTQSGRQLVSFARPLTAGRIVGSGGIIAGTGGSIGSGTLLVPVGYTVKAVFAHPNPGKVIGAILYRYMKFYNP